MKFYLKNPVILLLHFTLLSVICSGCGESTKKDVLEKPVVGKFEVTVTTTGELQAKNSIDIQGPVNARKAGIFQIKIQNLVAEGTIVQKGEFVAELDKSEILTKIKEVEINLTKFQSQYTQAKLDCTLTLSQARDDLVNLKYGMEQRKLEKEESLYEAPSTKRQAEIEFEKAERAYKQAVINYDTKVKQAEAKMREVEADLFKEQSKMADYQEIFSAFTILAPENGMVIYAREWDGKKKGIGSTISGWNPVVATLPDLSIMESITYVNEVDIQKLKVGQEVRIGLEANPDKKLTGKVTQVANVGEQRPNTDSKVYEVKIIVNEADSALRPAMTTSNEIIISTDENVMSVPLESVHTVNDSIRFVYLNNGGSIVKKEIRLGKENDNYIIVKEGLTPEDEIFLSIPDKSEDLPFEPIK